MDLKIKSIIKKHRNDNDIISNKDAVSIFNDISSTSVKLNLNTRPEYALSDSLKLINRIIKKIHNKRIQTLRYSDLPAVLKIIETYINNKGNLKGAF